jgi:ribosomal protein S18 acetylase RimI-like enzyme
MVQINIRSATDIEFDTVIAINPSIEIKKTWQMDQGFENGVLTTKFREVPLPRSMRLTYPNPVKMIRQNLDENDLNLVAEENKRIVGFLSLVKANGIPSAVVTDLVVDENFRRRGIASSLLISAVDWLINRKVNGITLEMMLKNYPAITLAQKLGFEFCGFNDVYFQNGQTAIFFNRKIN